MRDVDNQEINQLRETIATARKRLWEIRTACEHDFKPSDPEWLDASTPVCGKCGTEKHGWWCETSPTKQCNYEQSDGDYNYDQCRYCGNPEERK